VLIYLEDVQLGLPKKEGQYLLPREEVIEFARKWDPQPWHLDDEAAAKTIFGRISACYSHVFAILSKLTGEREDELVIVAGLGFEEMFMKKPAYPGDVLQLESEYLEKRASRSKPDRGIVTTRFLLRNQHGDEVIGGRGRAMVARRPTP
jgi:acyl dehydratase